MTRSVGPALIIAMLAACGGGGGGSSSEGDVVTKPSPSPSPDTVITQCGTFEGIAADNVVAFKGMPYAQPPTGALRWQAPLAPDCAAQPVLASDFSPACAQLTDDGAVASLTEDCLYLNVWAPTTEFPTSEKKPVLVFIHGGGNQRGSTDLEQLGVQLYDGTRLAGASDTVVVTIAYRLGALGFLAHPALSAENSDQRSGNYGLLDQLAALEWVQNNIADFGGDPDHVTLFGESGGARDVCSLVASPLANGLFSGAIMQSGGCRQITMADAEIEGQNIANAAGCASVRDASCLRAATPRQLLEAVGAEVFDGAFVGNNIGPVVDNYVLMASPDEVIAAGAHNMVPLIFGTNAQETGNRVALDLSEAAYEALVLTQFGPNLGNLILTRYPAPAYTSPTAAYVAFTTDVQFICAARRVAQQAAMHSQPVFTYRFSKSFESTVLENFGAFHGIELFYLFQQMSALDGYVATAADQRVEADMASYWGSFARNGHPNGVEGVARTQWEPFSPTADNVLMIDKETTQVSEPRASECEFLDQFSGT